MNSFAPCLPSAGGLPGACGSGNAAGIWARHWKPPEPLFLIHYVGIKFFHRVVGGLKKLYQSKFFTTYKMLYKCEHLLPSSALFEKEIFFPNLISSSLNIYVVASDKHSDSRQGKKVFVTRISSWALDFGHLDYRWTCPFNMDLNILKSNETKQKK